MELFRRLVLVIWTLVRNVSDGSNLTNRESGTGNRLDKYIGHRLERNMFKILFAFVYMRFIFLPG